MSKWERHETYRKHAREFGYRSRAAFKLLQIENRFSIFQEATRIVDLCCAPGSWLQVIVQHCHSTECRVVGVDTSHVKPIEGVEFIQSPIDAPDLISRIQKYLGGQANLVLSDCSPKLTGSKTVDRERQHCLAQTSLSLALQLLRKHGNFVAKVFQSKQTQELVTKSKQFFSYAKLFKPDASIKSSPEMYLVAKGFQGETTRTC